MLDFLICIGEYLIKALFYVAVAAVGVYLGIKKRKKTDANNAAAKEE